MLYRKVRRAAGMKKSIVIILVLLTIFMFLPISSVSAVEGIRPSAWGKGKTDDDGNYVRLLAGASVLNNTDHAVRVRCTFKVEFDLYTGPYHGWTTTYRVKWEGRLPADGIKFWSGMKYVPDRVIEEQRDLPGHPDLTIYRESWCRGA